MKRCLLAFVFSILAISLHAQNDLPWTKSVGARKTPTATQIFWVNDFGRIEDSSTVISSIIQKAIDDCARKGGGIVAFKPGVYTMGSIFIKKNVHFRVDKGVLLKGSTNFADYPEINTRIAGIEMRWPAALINIIDQQNMFVSDCPFFFQRKNALHTLPAVYAVFMCLSLSKYFPLHGIKQNGSWPDSSNAFSYKCCLVIAALSLLFWIEW